MRTILLALAIVTTAPSFAVAQPGILTASS
jgi:hypothetical protein